MQRVLVVDDVESNLLLASRYLADVECEVVTASDGDQALACAGAVAPDLVLLDVAMPGLDGLEVCRRLKSQASTRLVPVVMLTAFNAVHDRVEALEAGADDFLAKPVDRTELRARVTSMLRLKELYDNLEESEQVIFALARAVEAKDSSTEQHMIRVAEDARRLAVAVGVSGRDLESLYRGALIHDVGKIAVPDAVLGKAGRLEPFEIELIKLHPGAGADICAPLKSAARLREVVRHHHERYDGGGYPDGLAGPQIPLAARIVAVCDAFDAMTSDRPYRRGLSPEEACSALLAGAATQWDPELVLLFVAQHGLQPLLP